MTFKHEHPNFECEFEIEPYSSKLTGAMRATIFEEGEDGPQEHIRIDRDVYVAVEWFLHGHLTRHLCGSYCIGVHFESIGKGKEYSFGPYEVEMEPCGDGHYREVVRIPAGTIKAGDCGKVYLTAITLTSKDACGEPGHIRAFCKEGCVMFVEPPADH